MTHQDVRPARHPHPTASPLAKVPEVTALFWAVKICTTGMGEAASDFMGNQPIPVAAGLVLLCGAAFTAAFVLQFRARGYVPWIYWSCVAMVSVFGTMVADGIRVGLGISYVATTAVFAVAVAVSLAAWYRSEGTLSIHSINSRRREVFYWSTVVATFALGTAAGDLTAATLGLGFLASGVLFAVLIAVPLVVHLRHGDPIVTFWWAYILTRPLGASFADWTSVPHQKGGLALGTGPVTLTLVAVIVALVATETRSGVATAIPATGSVDAEPA